MIVPFNEIPKEAKVWIFPSSRKLYKQEFPEVKKSIENFLQGWGSSNFNAAYEIKYDRFIVIAADDTKKSLAIDIHDDLTSFIQELEQKYTIILLDRINVCYKQGEFVQYKDLKEFKKMIKAKGVSQKTIVFNNMITTVDEYEYDWEINIMDSWLGRFL